METLVHWRRFGLALLVLCGCLSHGAAARQVGPSEGVGSDAALDLLLTREAQRLLDLDRMEQSLPTNVTVTARADIAGRRLIIDFGPGFLPAEDDGSTEEVVQDIRGSVRYYMERAVLEEVQVDILYEGLPLHRHFPSPRQRV
ncbi:hypothetical protein ACLB90_19350 [Stenotrophomonas sp. LGBM10]|uniref:hypothetical protein n=1 Tax=Stenotrophomonas sp. LGBM10 TaxID=3390038 RepID=UPI00398A89FC